MNVHMPHIDMVGVREVGGVEVLRYVDVRGGNINMVRVRDLNGVEVLGYVDVPGNEIDMRCRDVNVNTLGLRSTRIGAIGLTLGYQRYFVPGDNFLASGGRQHPVDCEETGC